MTVYAFSRASAELLAVWTCPVGSEAEVAGPAGSIPEDVARKVSHLLTAFSSTMWEAYQRRRGPDVDFLSWSDALIAVGGGDIDGAGPLGLGEVETAAHRLGALVAAMDDAALTSTVREQLRRDLDAVRAACRGVFAGRSVQAVVFDRGAPVALQVMVAEAALATDPLTPRWPAGVDPVSACVAVVRWLAVAARVAGDAVGVGPAEVFLFADGMAPLDTDIPGDVVRRVGAGAAPADAVAELLGGEDPDFSGSPVSGGQDLLDQLLLGMAGCALVFLQGHADDDLRSADEARHEQARDRILDRFRAVVRAAGSEG